MPLHRNNSFADRVIEFNNSLVFNGKLPEGISIMNPFKENPKIIPLSSSFYKKYYNDNNPRYLILGINPGRFGAGLTGICFTDPKRLQEKCKIKFDGELAHEPSSVFIYDMIDAYGGVAKFYGRFYINAVCPLGFTITGKNGKPKNYNYYDSKILTGSAYNFIIKSMKAFFQLGIQTDVCFCLGTGKNEKFLVNLNNEMGFFKEIIPLEHPRYIMQYKLKSKQYYIDKYLNAFKKVTK